MIEMSVKEQELVNELIEKTKKGVVKWNETAEENEFFATFRTEFKVFVAELTMTHEDDYGNVVGAETLHTLQVGDSKKRTLVNLREPEKEGGYSILKALFEAARESARKYINEGLDAILQELKKEG